MLESAGERSRGIDIHEPTIRPRCLADSINRRSFLEPLGLWTGRPGAGRFARSASISRREQGGRYGKARGSLARRRQSRRTLPVKARRVIHLCMAGGPSQFETFDWKPRAEASSTASRSRSRSPRGSSSPSCRARCSRHAGRRRRLPEARAVGPGDLRPFPAHRRHRRRHLHHPLDADRADQSRPCARLHELGLDHQGAAEHGLVAALRSGVRVGRTCPASSCSPRRAGPASSRSRPGSGRRAILPSKFQGILFQSKGDAVHYIGSPDGSLPEHAAAGHRRGQPPQRHAGRGHARPRDPDPDQPVRAGVPDAGLGARADRFRKRAAGDARHLRREAARRRQLRLELPAGAAARRARGPVHPALSPRLGSPQQPRSGDARRRGRRGPRPVRRWSRT